MHLGHRLQNTRPFFRHGHHGIDTSPKRDQHAQVNPIKRALWPIRRWRNGHVEKLVSRSGWRLDCISIFLPQGTKPEHEKSAGIIWLEVASFVPSKKKPVFAKIGKAKINRSNHANSMKATSFGLVQKTGADCTEPFCRAR